MITPQKQPRSQSDQIGRFVVIWATLASYWYIIFGQDWVTLPIYWSDPKHQDILDHRFVKLGDFSPKIPGHTGASTFACQ